MPEVIFAYTRADALEDSVLRDITEMASEAGIKYPTACTAGLWGELVVPSEFARETMCNSEDGRLWDVLWMFVCATKGSIPHKNYREGVSDVLEYEALFVMGDRPEAVPRTIRAVCGPGDDMSPVITFMLPDED